MFKEKRLPLTIFKALNFFNADTDWEQISTKFKEIKWSEELNDEDPNTVLSKFYTLCLDISNEYVPKRTQDEVKKINKVLHYRRSLCRRRLKITKRLIQVKSNTVKLKITNELLQIEKDLQKSFRRSDLYMEDKVVKAIKSNSKFFSPTPKRSQKLKRKLDRYWTSLESSQITKKRWQKSPLSSM